MVPRLETLLHTVFICTAAFGGGTILPLALLVGTLSTEKLSSLPKVTQLVCRELGQHCITSDFSRGAEPIHTSFSTTCHQCMWPLHPVGCLPLCLR